MEAVDWMRVAAWLAEAVVAPALASALAAAAAWLATVLPGPLKNWLYSAIHQRDVALVTGALWRGAAASLARGDSPEVAAARAVGYARGNVGDTVAKLAVPDDTLRVMATAAVQEQRRPAAEKAAAEKPA